MQAPMTHAVLSNSVLRAKFGLIFNLGLVNSCDQTQVEIYGQTQKEDVTENAERIVGCERSKQLTDMRLAEIEQELNNKAYQMSYSDKRRIKSIEVDIENIKVGFIYRYCICVQYFISRYCICTQYFISRQCICVQYFSSRQYQLI